MSFPSSSKLLVRYRSHHHGYKLFHDAVAIEPIVMLHLCTRFIFILWYQTSTDPEPAPRSADPMRRLSVNLTDWFMVLFHIYCKMCVSAAERRQLTWCFGAQTDSPRHQGPSDPVQNQLVGWAGGARGGVGQCWCAPLYPGLLPPLHGNCVPVIPPFVELSPTVWTGWGGELEPAGVGSF